MGFGSTNQADRSDGPPPNEKGGIQGLFTGCAPCRHVPGMNGNDVGRVSALVLQNANLEKVLGAAPQNYVKMLQGSDLLLKAERSCHTEKCVVS